MASAGNSGPDDESTKISLYVPGFLVKFGSCFVHKDKDPQVKEALKKMRSISLVIRDGRAYNEYNASGKFEKKNHRLQKQNFSDLVLVNDDGAHVSIKLKQNKKGTIRQLAVIVDDDEETYVFARIRCNVSMKDLKGWLKKDGVVNKMLPQDIDI